MFGVVATKLSLHNKFGTCKYYCWNKNPIKVKLWTELTLLVGIVLEHFVQKSTTQYCRQVCYFKKEFILQFGNWNYHEFTAGSVEPPLLLATYF